METIYRDIVCLYQIGYKYDFSTIPFIPTHPLRYIHSPIETLYLKVAQYEQLGMVMDIDYANSIIHDDYNYSVPRELVQEMKKMSRNPINPEDIGQYIEKNEKKLAKYVYFDKDIITPYDEDKLKNCIHKFPKLIKFFQNTYLDIDIKNCMTELRIISCLQAMLVDSQNETVNYPFHASQERTKQHKPLSVQAALKNDKPVCRFLQCYWVRKVNDRLEANLGNHKARATILKVEHLCDSMLKSVLQESNLDDMLETHKFCTKMIIDDVVIPLEEVLEKYSPIFNIDEC